MSKSLPRRLTYCFLPVLLSVLLYWQLLYQPSQNYLLLTKNYGRIEIIEDSYGIPHISSETQEGTMFGMGLEHAKNRLFQMHIKRRCVSGRFSEVFGSKTISMDIQFLEFQLYEQSKLQVATLDEAVRKNLQAYADGVNYYHDSMSYFLPFEFYLINDRFYPWEVVDSLALWNLLGLTMSQDFIQEPFRENFRKIFGEDLANQVLATRADSLREETVILDDKELKQSDLYRIYSPSKHHRSAFEVENLNSVIETFETGFLRQQMGTLKGSNSWVVSGNLTKNGRPIVANDPHLDNVIPSHWFLAEVRFNLSTNGTKEEQNLLGANMAGFPFIVVGRNTYYAWGVTNNFVDNADLYLENIKDETYLFEGVYVPLNKRTVKLRVKSQNDLDLVLYSTRKGPLITSVVNLMNIGQPLNISHHQELSFAWTGYSPKNGIQVGYYSNIARSIQDIYDLQKYASSPNLNIVFGTIDNHIGYLNLGIIPIRQDPENVFIRDGTLQDAEWLGQYRLEDNPRVLDPEKQYIVTANNKLATDNLIHHSSVSMYSLGRAHRIDQMLKTQINSQQKIDIPFFVDMQKDSVDSYASFFITTLCSLSANFHQQVFNKTLQQNTKYYKYLQLLENWKYDNSEHSVEATLFNVFENQLQQKLFSQLSKNSTQNTLEQTYITMSFYFDHFLIKQLENWVKGNNLNELFCNNHLNIPYQDSISCVWNVLTSFAEAYQIIEEKSPQEQEWSNFHQHVFKHAPFSESFIKGLFERKIKQIGNKRTINTEGVNVGETSYTSTYSQNLKAIFDLDEKEMTYLIIDTGQSENIFSPHYTDQVRIFEKKQYIQMKIGEAFENANKLNYKLVQID